MSARDGTLETATVQLGLDNAWVQLGSVQALREFSLQIRAGERVALVGANGSGKSTLLRTLHGLLPLREGQRQTLPGLRQAMLFQRPHLLRLSALHNVALGLWLERSLGLSWAQACELAWPALDRVGLRNVASQRGRHLSGGQQQRLALARAWARQPDVLLLDEPTASLDPHAKREIEQLIVDYACHRQPAATLVWASHNLGQVKRIATRVLYLEGGRLLADLPVEDFFNDAVLWALSPQAHAFVQGERT